jgi:hypothetical protein
MRPFRDLPIARKTLTLGLLPTIFALIVAILASLLSTYVTARHNQQIDVESQAAIVADNAGAGLAFGDHQIVDEIVGALDVRSNIDTVCVYDKGGAIFSRFQRGSFARPRVWPAETPATVPVAVKDAMAGGNRVGTVYIRGNYSNLFNWLRQQSMVGFLALVSSVRQTWIAPALSAPWPPSSATRSRRRVWSKTSSSCRAWSPANCSSGPNRWICAP